MSFSYDRTGFPLITVPDLAVKVHLLPVTKVQFERFIAEADNDFGSKWYRKVLRLNSRVSYHQFTDKNRERLFITGVLPNEARVFAHWMGSSFDLPTVEEWRAIYRWLQKEPISSHHWEQEAIATSARIILNKLLAQTEASTLLDLSLMKDGVLEWSRRQDSKRVGLGQPRKRFFATLIDPLLRDHEPIYPKRRRKYLGIRLIKRFK